MSPEEERLVAKVLDKAWNWYSDRAAPIGQGSIENRELYRVELSEAIGAWLRGTGRR